MSRRNVQLGTVERIGRLERIVKDLRGLLLARTGHFLRGAGSPEGVVTAPPGTLYLDTVGGAGVTLWIKEANVDATGWVAK